MKQVTLTFWQAVVAGAAIAVFAWIVGMESKERVIFNSVEERGYFETPDGDRRLYGHIEEQVYKGFVVQQ